MIDNLFSRFSSDPIRAGRACPDIRGSKSLLYLAAWRRPLESEARYLNFDGGQRSSAEDWSEFQTLKFKL